jgi:5-methylcytosine-specific restriction endonuclease McrA
MALKDEMPLVVCFHTRTASIYSSMTKRFATKTNKRGNIIRPGRLVPFTLAEFRLWLMEKLGGKPEGSTRCAYCNTPLFADTVRVEHPVPVSRGGVLDFSNLVCACDRCNRMKGSLTDSEFKALQVVLGDMLRAGVLHPDGFKDIEKRLAGQAAIFRRFAPKKPKPESSGLLVDQPVQEKLLAHKLLREF